MRKAVLTAALLVPLLAAAQGKGVVVADRIEAVVTVTKVDAKARTVTIRGPQGNLRTLAVPKEAQNLDKVKAGDRFKVVYAEAVVLALEKGGKASTGVDQQVEVAPKGGTPGGTMVKTRHITGVIEAIDYKNRQVAVRGPGGNTVALPVSDAVKELERVTVGDTVTLAFSQALALEMLPQPKPAAKGK